MLGKGKMNDGKGCGMEAVKMHIKMPQKVRQIIRVLQEHGYEAFAVGGCVRDAVLKRKPEDWDITTSAAPEEVKKLFGYTIDTGIAHGTVTVMLGGEGFEVTTYRIDGEYEDARHPKNVEFTTKLEMDLERRDFTINAMAYNDESGLVDIFDGMGDIKRKQIRCVRQARLRFEEDALRMLRAVRFAGQLGFEIEENTKEAVKELGGNLRYISAERIRTELAKLLISPGAGRIRDAFRLGMTRIILPELDEMMEMEQKNPHHIYTVGEHSVCAVEYMNAFFGEEHIGEDGKESITEAAKRALGEDVYMRIRRQCGGYAKKQHIMLCFVMLLHDAAKPSCMTVDENGCGHFYGHPAAGARLAKQVFRRLKFDNETMDMAVRLIQWHDYRFDPGCREKKKAVRRAASKVGRDIMELLFIVQRADTLAQNPATYAAKLAAIEEAEELYREIVRDGECLSVKDLAVNGSDLMAAGMQAGPKLGAALKELLEYVLEQPEKNTKEALLEYVKQNYKEDGYVVRGKEHC